MNTHHSLPLTHLLLRRAADLKHEAIALAIKKDVSTVSRILSGENGVMIDYLEVFLDAFGLKVVEKDSVSIRPEMHQSLRVFSAVGLACQCAAKGEDYCGGPK
jgi:hypothetical protein